jgi:hypothetical protein
MEINTKTLPQEVHSLAKKVMEDGTLDFQRDAPVLAEIVDALFGLAKESLLDVLPGVTGRALINLITQQVLALDEEHGWDAPAMGEDREDQLLAWFVERRVRELIRTKLSEVPHDAA